MSALDHLSIAQFSAWARHARNERRAWNASPPDDTDIDFYDVYLPDGRVTNTWREHIEDTNRKVRVWR